MDDVVCRGRRVSERTPNGGPSPSTAVAVYSTAEGARCRRRVTQTVYVLLDGDSVVPRDDDELSDAVKTRAAAAGS